MDSDRDAEDLLASISDGEPADWVAAERGADAADRPRIAVLRGLSRIAEYHRSVQRSSDDRSGPERWGELVLLECIGAGRRGEVWRAWDPTLEREVAIKLMHPGQDDSSLLEEGRALARVRHPHVVNVLGVERRDGRVGMWMELVRGWNLEQLVRAQGPLDPGEARRLGLEIGAAVVAVHAAGLVHRDIKPANVMRDLEGRYVLADFGLGLREGARESGLGGPSGTPMYMAPEVLRGASASEQSDLYSLGMLLWFALAGRHPYDVKTLAELTVVARLGPEPALQQLRRGIPTALADIVERSIAPEPAVRFAGVRQMHGALENWKPRRPLTWRERVMVLVATAAIINVIFLGVRLLERIPAREAAPPAATPAAPAYSVEAQLLTREGETLTRLVSGDRVKPGQHLWLQVRVTQPAWIYVLNEDERGERYLLFPQPRFNVSNPLPADSTLVLPGRVDGEEYAWTVTSAGGREHVLVVASPTPIADIEADLAKLPRTQPGRPVAYAPVGDAAVEQLRGIGGMDPLSPGAAPPLPERVLFDRFRALAGRETDVHGVWIRQIVLENPAK